MEGDNNRSPVDSSRQRGFSKKATPFTIRNRAGNDDRVNSFRRNLDERDRKGLEPKPRTLEERLATFGINMGGVGASRSSSGESSGDRRQVESDLRATKGLTLHELSGESMSDLSDRKSARLSSDINRRISGISTSMEEFDKKVKDANETMNAAYRKSVQDSMRNRKEKEGSPGGSSPDSLEIYLKKSRDNLAKDLLVELGPDYVPPSTPPAAAVVGPAGDSHNNVHLRNKVGDMSPRKIFGLDSTAILESSSSEDSSSEEDDDDDSSSSDDSDEDSGAGAMRISIRHAKGGKSETLKKMEENAKAKKEREKQWGRVPRSKIKRKPKIPPELQPEPRSLSPIMPSLPDKQFQSILERREERTSRNLNSMKLELAQLNQKVEIDRRKAGSLMGKSSNPAPAARKGMMDTNYQGRPMRLMKTQPDKVLNSELNEFVQASGGKAGSWDRKDHVSFMKIFDVWKNHPNKLMEALRKELPSKKPQDIASHIKWYERFEELSSKNKQNVQKWSLEKRRENEMVYQMGSASQRAKMEGEKRRQEHLRIIREQERDKSKAKLAQWKRSQSVRCTTAGSTTGPAASQKFSHELNHSPSPSMEVPQGFIGDRPSTSTIIVQKNKKSRRIQQPAPDEPILPGEYRDDTGNLDIPGIRQHILEITAKVHSLDHPKREFLPPRPLPPRKREGLNIPQEPQNRDISRGYSHSHLQRVGSSSSVRKTPVGKLEEDVVKSSRRGSVRLPEIDSDILSRPGSRPGSRPVQSQRSKLSEYREIDNRIVEAKRKAIEIARDRRRANLSQLTAEELRRRIRSRPGPSQIMNPTKQSELRKSLTHLERLEMLSKQDLSFAKQSKGLPPSPESISSGGRGLYHHHEDATLPPIINNVPTKGIPNWRRPTGDY